MEYSLVRNIIMDDAILNRKRRSTNVLFVTVTSIPLWVTMYFVYFPQTHSPIPILVWLILYFAITNMIAFPFYQFRRVWPSDSENKGYAGLRWIGLVLTNLLATGVLYLQTPLVNTAFFELYSIALLANLALIFLIFRRHIIVFARTHPLL